MQTEIEWEVTEQNVSQELVSKDKRWHISKKKDGAGEPELFVANFDILLTPCGIGKDLRECFETFLQKCDEYEKQLIQVRDEAKAYLKSLSSNGKNNTK